MLVVHRATSATALAEGLAGVLAQPPTDPFAAEVVAVPAKGVERWIAHRLAHVLGTGDAGSDGVCANVRFPRPSRMLDEAVQATSPEHARSVASWAPERAVWTLLDVVDEACAKQDPWCAVLAQHLGAPGADKGRRLSVLTKLARLFDSYGSARPAMVRAWAAGSDEQGDGTPMADDLRWQAELWRRLRARLGVPAPAELLDDACARLRAEPGLSDLPERLSVFGASRISPARLAVLAALGKHRDVHLWLHHASPVLWEKARLEMTGRTPEPLRRREDRTARDLENLLLASMSRDVRELQQLLTRLAPGHGDVLHPAPAPPPTLLGRLKQGLADDAVPDAPPPLNSDDRSVTLHACHGRARQVEVLREAILGLLSADPTLEPRDVLVMCPDVETFAPLIAATFALGAEDDASHPAARLRVRLADRALTQTNELLAVLQQLLDLGTARITASQVLDFAAVPAVRRRFRFDDDDLERLHDWVTGASIRWGLHAEHRRTWQLDNVAQGTWRAGLDRLLLGAAMPESLDAAGSAALDALTTVPLDDVDSADIDLAGRLAELLDRLDRTQTLLAGHHDAASWLTGLAEAVLSLAAAPPDGDWQERQLRGEIADLTEAAADSTALVGLADMRALLADVLAGRPTRASFRTGTLTVCTLVPMRSVPHRVVCLLGLDDGVFPRQTSRDGDDVLARDPWIGERDPRSEDRQLLLDAISAAGEHLVITYTGADERTGAPVPPAVPLEELLDALDRTATAPDGGRVRDAITVRHPLQPFDPRNFTRGALRAEKPFSFDPIGYAGAVAAAGPRAEPPVFLPAPLPAAAGGDIELADVIKMFEHPARGFLRQRLQVAVTWEDPEPEDALPVELNHLELWAVGERLLAMRLSGVDQGTCRDLELRRGSLPPGPLGATCLQAVGGDVDALVSASADERKQTPDSYDLDLDLGPLLGEAGRLTGTIGDMHGDVLLSVSYSKLGPKHRLGAWIRLLALTVAHPDREWRAITVGRGAKGGVQRSLLGPLSPTDATAALGELLAVYRSGLLAPLPLPLKTAAEYASRRQRGMPTPAARASAEQKWRTDRFPGEQSDTEHELVYGAGAALAVLTAARPGPGEGGPGWHADETDRFGLLARRVWSRLLDAETTEQR